MIIKNMVASMAIGLSVPCLAQTTNYVEMVKTYQKVKDFHSPSEVLKILNINQSEIVGTPWKLIVSISRIEEVKNSPRDFTQIDFFSYLNLTFSVGGIKNLGSVVISHSELDFIEQEDGKDPIVVHSDHVIEENYQIIKNAIRFNGPQEFISSGETIALLPFACGLVEFLSAQFLICEFDKMYHKGENQFSGRIYHVFRRDIL